MLRDESNYVSGIVKMASCHMHPSYMDAECFRSVSQFLKENSSSESALKELDDFFEPFLMEILHLDKEEGDCFFHLIHCKAGDAKKIYEIHDKNLLNYIQKYVPFYTLEDVYLVEFEKMVICFTIGNDE